jgi:hypothetical protein
MPVKFEFPRIDDREEVRELLVSLKTALPSLEALLLEANERGVYEDFVYRFYHQSFKVYSLQATTERIVAALRALALDRARKAPQSLPPFLQGLHCCARERT